MSKGFTCIAAAIMFIMCGCGNVLTLEVSNPLDLDRHPELAEVSLTEIQERLHITDNDFVIQSEGREIPYQITHDAKVVFPVELKSLETKVFCFREGTPAEVVEKVRGDHYPRRVDDICWENDKVGFRVYGFKEDNPSGYDIFTKRNTDLPAIPEMYRKAFDPELKKIHKELKKIDKDSAARFHTDNISFHVDHGFGADFYGVGPTLGAGTSALVDGDEIVYPFCYDSFEMLDNGPLRFTIKLTFRPFTFGESKNVTETRVISLDLGSHFNKTTVSFANLDSVAPIVSGIVLQDTDGKALCDTSKGYVAYPAPTMNFDKQRDVDNGIIYVANVYPCELSQAGISYFTDKESKARGGAKGHVLAHSQYDPAQPFTYYWGFGWNYSDMPTYEDWINHVETFSLQLRNPIILTMK